MYLIINGILHPIKGFRMTKRLYIMKVAVENFGVDIAP